MALIGHSIQMIKLHWIIYIKIIYSLRKPPLITEAVFFVYTGNPVRTFPSASNEFVALKHFFSEERIEPLKKNVKNIRK